MTNSPIRLGFHQVGGSHWIGGRNYLSNLLKAIDVDQRVESVLFVSDEEELDERVRVLDNCEIVRTDAFKPTSARRLAVGTIPGFRDPIHQLFANHGIHVAFEHARFFGSRCPVPVVAWLPDFQHRHLSEYFSRPQYWRRDIGFRLQTRRSRNGRLVMVSSEDARADCETFYPSSRGRVRSVPFALPFQQVPSLDELQGICKRYDLPARYVFLPNQFYRHKNHLTVAHALRILRDQDVEVTVATTGSPKDPRGAGTAEELRQYLDAHGLHTMRLLGVVPYKDMSGLLHGAMALLNPSLFEGWSTTVEEAKAAGVPLLLSHLAVHREQAPEAAFFDPHNPSDLAEQLAALKPPVRANESELAARASRSVEVFADRFIRVVSECAGRTMDPESHPTPS